MQKWENIKYEELYLQCVTAFQDILLDCSQVALWFTSIPKHFFKYKFI